MNSKGRFGLFMKKAKETRGKQSSWRSKNWQIKALFLTCLTLLSVLAACGESSSPTAQPGAVATATDQATPSNPPITIVATTTAETNTTPVATTTVVSTTSASTTITAAATTTNPATTEVVTTVLPTTTVAATTVAAPPATTTVVVTKPAATATPRSAPVATTTVPAKASGGQSHTFTEKDNNGSVQLKVADTLLAQLNPELDWTFEVVPNNGVLSAPSPAAKPYEDSFKALATGTVQIKAFGKCHPVPDKICFQAIISQTITVNVN